MLCWCHVLHPRRSKRSAKDSVSLALLTLESIGHGGHGGQALLHGSTCCLRSNSMLLHGRNL